MAQNRRPPAFQEYAAELLASFDYRSLSLQDRGLLHTMRLECWINRQLPNNPELLAKVFGLPVNEVTDSLPRVMNFFIRQCDFIVCPELENYREHLEDIRQRKSAGGTNSAAAKAKHRRNKSIKSVSNDTSSILKES